MEPKPYRPSIRRLQEEWASRIAWQQMRRRRPTRPPSKITDNSEAWIENPSSVTEFWEIACRVNETVSQWQQPLESSSEN